MTNYLFDTYVQYFINIFTLIVFNDLTFEISLYGDKTPQKHLFSYLINKNHINEDRTQISMRQFMKSLNCHLLVKISNNFAMKKIHKNFATWSYITN